MLANLSVRLKILFLSVVMIAIICIVAGVGIYFNNNAKDSINEMYNSNLTATQFLNDANGHFRNIDVDIAYILLGGSGLDRGVLQDDIIGRLEGIKGNVAKLKEIVNSEKSQKLLGELDAHVDQGISAVNATKGLGNTPEDRIKLYKNLMIVKAIANDLDAITPDNVFQGKVLFEANDKAYATSLKIFAVIVILGLLFGISAAIYIARGIANPLERSIEELNAVAQGDLTRHIPQELTARGDEVGTVVQALDKMQRSLRDILKNVRDEAQNSVTMAERVQELIKKLDEHTQDMSATTEQMAAGTEETAATTANIQTLSDSVNEEIQSTSEESKRSEAYANEIDNRAAQLQEATSKSVKASEELYGQTK